MNLYPPGPQTTAAAVFRTTGPVEHVDALVRSVGDSATVDLARTETDIYGAAGLSYVPPPARSRVLEVPGELVGTEHLRGDLHVHSDWSPDGRQTIEDLVRTARARGLDYVAITDHAKGLRFGGLDEERLERQRETIERIRPRYPDIVILHGSELNIDRNGDVDFGDGVVARLDLTIAAVHSHFALDRVEQTRRLLTAISNPNVNVVAHLTGRRIGIRPPIELDMELVLSAAVEHGTALEVNGHLDRMDAPAQVVGRGCELGVLFAANSDAHRGSSSPTPPIQWEFCNADWSLTGRSSIPGPSPNFARGPRLVAGLDSTDRRQLRLIGGFRSFLAAQATRRPAVTVTHGLSWDLSSA